jgi:metal-responsive CopG/Arc/MetJ family transcriptional regulator
MSDPVIIDSMSKRIRTVPVHARLPEQDIREVDKAADEELTSRSNMIARIVRQWALQRRVPPKKQKK